MTKNSSEYSFKKTIINSIYRLVFCFIFIAFFIQCSEGELTAPQQPTTISYGACEKSEDTRFSIENCNTPSTCHVKDIGDGFCRPSCGYLAQINEDGEYGGYGRNNQKNDEDDPHFLAKNTSCDDLEKWGANDWKKISLVNDLEPWDVIQNRDLGYTNSECCGSDQQVETNNAQ